MNLSQQQVIDYCERMLAAFIEETKDDRKHDVYFKKWTPQEAAKVWVRNWYDVERKSVKKCPNCGTYNYHYLIEHNLWCCAFC